MQKLESKRVSAQIVTYFVLSAWCLIYLVPTELQEISTELVPVKWWSNIISVLLFGMFALVSFAVIFWKQPMSKFKWSFSVFGNPWLWSFLLISYLGLHFLFRPNALGLNFAMNLVILSIGLPHVLSAFHLISNRIPIIAALTMSVGLAVNWIYQLANQISYFTNPDIEFAHALSVLVVILLSVAGRTSNLWWILGLQGFFYVCFVFLATSQLRLPAFIAAIFFALHSLWQARPWLQRLIALSVNTLLAFVTWFLVVERGVISQGSLYISGRAAFYDPIRATPRPFSEVILGSGFGFTRGTLLTEIGYGNPHSSLLVLATDYGIVGSGLALGLAISILKKIYELRVENQRRTRALFATVALLVSFGGLSLFAEPVETTLVTLTTLVVFLVILLGLGRDKKIVRASRDLD